MFPLSKSSQGDKGGRAPRNPSQVNLLNCDYSLSCSGQNMTRCIVDVQKVSDRKCNEGSGRSKCDLGHSLAKPIIRKDKTVVGETAQCPSGCHANVRTGAQNPCKYQLGAAPVCNSSVLLTVRQGAAKCSWLLRTPTPAGQELGLGLFSGLDFILKLTI